MTRTIRAAVTAAILFSSATASEAAVLNGSFSVITSSAQIGTVNDTTGFTNLVLNNGVPQSTDLFDIFAFSPVTSQPIRVAFNFTQAGVGAFGGTAIGTVSASTGINDAASVSFSPLVLQVPLYGTLAINLSGASFASDYNGTVIATFVEAVPEPSSAALLGLGLAGVAATIARRARRGFVAA